WNRRRDWDRTNRNATNWQAWVPEPQRAYDWNRQRSWNTDRDWTRPDWNRTDWERRNNIRRGSNIPSGGASPTLNRGGAVPPPPMAPAVTAPVVNSPPADMGDHKGDTGRRGRDNKGTPSSQGGAVTPPSQ